MDVNSLVNKLSEGLSGADTGSVLCMVIIIALLCSVFIKGTKKLSGIIGAVISFCILYEILHITSFYTSFGDSLPIMKTIFQYDVIGAIAAPFEGTKFAALCVEIEANLIVVMNYTVQFCSWLLDTILSELRA